MADFLSIEVVGNAELRKALSDAVGRIERPRELLQSIGAVLEVNIERRFDAKRDPTGKRWAPRTQSTLDKYDRDEATGKRDKQTDKPLVRGTLLERTRQMRDSLTSNVGENFVEVGMSRLTDKGKWSIPLLHETGTRRMPRRGIFLADPDAGTLGADDEADVSTEITDFLDGVFGN
jgi:phage gpG-like protein